MTAIRERQSAHLHAGRDRARAYRCAVDVLDEHPDIEDDTRAAVIDATCDLWVGRTRRERQHSLETAYRLYTSLAAFEGLPEVDELAEDQAQVVTRAVILTPILLQLWMVEYGEGILDTTTLWAPLTADEAGTEEWHWLPGVRGTPYQAGAVALIAQQQAAGVDYGSVPARECVHAHLTRAGQVAHFLLTCNEERLLLPPRTPHHLGRLLRWAALDPEDATRIPAILEAIAWFSLVEHARTHPESPAMGELLVATIPAAWGAEAHNATLSWLMEIPARAEVWHRWPLAGEVLNFAAASVLQASGATEAAACTHAPLVVPALIAGLDAVAIETEALF